ncbi:YndJ family protein [Alkalicoccobacillus porphyridii]|uniref:YndJ family transporter n=1 Tax=Alkalicoccobacillus porphyridii TaxID=2597270 RepID=A0A554A3Q6_9BACI|nr:YndJ family protein [Alkalicoccobacillus porphyridii]TSB48323.1 hypothetical protein FN960_01865 [Alkalicoccobacillus porphyridii]
MIQKQWILGFGFWIILAWLMPTSIHILLSFSILVLFPMVLLLAYHRSKKHDAFLLMQPLFSLTGAISLLIEPGLYAAILASVWFAYTLWAAAKGFSRAAVRGFRRAEENAIDAAFIYMPAGGLWLLLSQSGIEGLPFSPVIVLLTAVHFHYSSLVVPIAAGMLGRYVAALNIRIKGFVFLTTGIIVGPILVGLGITLGGIFDISFVVFYTAMMMWLAIESIRLMLTQKGIILARIFVGLAASLSVAAMLLTVIYSTGISFGNSYIAIDMMVRYHGYVQAFGYSFLTLAGWSLLRPQPPFHFGQFRLSQLRGGFKIGNGFLEKSRILNKERAVSGLVDRFSVFNQPSFNSEVVDRRILQFYENTNDYDMVAVTSWHGVYKPLSHIYSFVTGKIAQLHLQPNRKHPMKQRMKAIIYNIDESIDGRHPVRAWIRQDHSTEKEIFVAFYAYYQTDEKVYMDIALPLPGSVMTGILRPQHDSNNGLILTSFRKKNQLGDEGVYLTMFGNWTLRLPIEEYFHVKAHENSNRLTAVHQLYFFKLRCLTIEYEITCKLEKQL